MSADYSYWLGKLAGNDPDPPADRTQMPCGFWRLRNNLPLAVWIDAFGDRLALQGFASNQSMLTESRREAMAEQGGFGVAVTEDAYREAYITGAWADDPPPIGHNLPDDPFEALCIEIDGEVELASEFLRSPITTQEHADKAAVWARRVGLLAKRADETREVEKRPHLEASRAVDDKFRSIIEAAKDLSARLKKHLEPFLIAQKQAELEKQRAAEDEARRLRQAAMATDQKDTEQQRALLQQAAQVEKRGEPKNASAGRTAMKVSLRIEKRARIVDYDACLTALKDTPQIREVVEHLANSAARAGLPLPGVEIEEFHKAA